MPNKKNDESFLESLGSLGSFGNETTTPKKKYVFETYERKTKESSTKAKEILLSSIPAELSMIHYWCGLFLSSFMVFFFAGDAVLHCNDMFGSIEQNDEERRFLEEYYEQTDDIQSICLQVFQTKILVPSFLGLILSGSVIAFLIRLNGSAQLKVPLEKAKVKMVGSHGSATFHSNNIPRDSPEQREQRRQAPLLGFVAFLSSIVWGAEIYTMMLKDPMRCQGKECNDATDAETYVFRDTQGDEISSLGAVNSMGEVGTNANLFYFSWISFFLSASLCYAFSCSPFVHNKNSLDVTSNKKLSIYSYRLRMGTWISMTICSLVVVTASTKIWREIVAYREYRIGQITYDDATVLNDDFWSILLENDDNPFYSKFLPVLFDRTKIALNMGLAGTIISTGAIFAHWFVGQSEVGLPLALWIELILSLLQFLLFGIAGWFVTGTGGPAQSVGVLYYSTMAIILLSLRIFVGCVEEVIEAHVPVNIPEDENNISNFKKQLELSNIESSYASMDSPSVISAQATMMSRNTYEVINYRPGDLRRWALIATFSSLNLGAVMDGINHTEIVLPDDDGEAEDPVDRALQWMIFAPSMAILISSFFFFLTLRPQSYYFVVKHKITLLGSLLNFAFWCSNLLITMHAQSSFAVNRRGEILAANQYYFSWASCSTSFLNFLSYLNRGKPESLLAVLWSAILKISLVMISAAVHVWGNIRENCEDESIYEDYFHFSFCRRTKFALYAGYIALVISVLLLISRIPDFQHLAILELITSFSMAILFTLGTYFITGINGPGQVVGDLYYATWGVLTFSVFISETCWEQFSEQYLQPIVAKGSDVQYVC